MNRYIGTPTRMSRRLSRPGTGVVGANRRERIVENANATTQPTTQPMSRPQRCSHGTSASPSMPPMAPCSATQPLAVVMSPCERMIEFW